MSTTPTITISGGAASGKSTLAMLIAQALHQAGIDYVIANEDTLPSALVENQPPRLQALAQRLRLEDQQIVIEQVQIRRVA